MCSIHRSFKFKFNLKFSPALHEDNYISLEKWRIILYRMSMIGEYKTKELSYGDLSKRILVGEDQFIITGNGTGMYANLDGTQYSRVLKCDLKRLTVEATGPIAPSAQSYLHFLFYKTCPQINFLFQIEHSDLASFMQQGDFTKLTTDPDFDIMAQQIQSKIGDQSSGIIVTEQNQILSFGPTPELAGKLVLETLKNSKNDPL